jgi:hypothetical protein
MTFPWYTHSKILVINRIVDLWYTKSPKEIKISKQQEITHLDYTDNMILLATSKGNLQRASKGLNRILQVFAVEISESEIREIRKQEQNLRRIKMDINSIESIT